MARGTNVFMTILLIVLVLGIGLLYVGKVVIRRRAFSGWSAQQIQGYHDWREKPLTFLDEDLEVYPFEEATVAAAISFRNEWEEHKDSANVLGNAFKDFRRLEKKVGEDPEWQSLVDRLSQLEPLLNAFEILAHQPDYEIDALAAGVDVSETFGLPGSNFLSCSTVTRLLQLKTIALTEQGKYSEAFDAAETIIRSSKTHKYSILISRLIGVAMFSMGTDAWHEAVESCDDAQLLRMALDAQNLVVPGYDLIVKDDKISATDQIGIILQAKREGVEVRINGLTARELFGEAGRVQAEYLEKIVLPAITDEQKREQVNNWISSYRTMSAIGGGEAQDGRGFLAKLASSYGEPMLYSIMVPNFLGAPIRGSVAQTKFDLLRTYTAAKLYTIEQQQEPSQITDLAPEYLPEVLNDRFAPGKRPITLQPVHYSVGPDKTDQKATVEYDPTNGTMSAGDIFYPLPR